MICWDEPEDEKVEHTLDNPPEIGEDFFDKKLRDWRLAVHNKRRYENFGLTTPEDAHYRESWAKQGISHRAGDGSWAQQWRRKMADRWDEDAVRNPSLQTLDAIMTDLYSHEPHNTNRNIHVVYHAEWYGKRLRFDSWLNDPDFHFLGQHRVAASLNVFRTQVQMLSPGAYMFYKPAIMAYLREFAQLAARVNARDARVPMSQPFNSMQHQVTGQYIADLNPNDPVDEQVIRTFIGNFREQQFPRGPGA